MAGAGGPACRGAAPALRCGAARGDPQRAAETREDMGHGSAGRRPRHGDSGWALAGRLPVPGLCPGRLAGSALLSLGQGLKVREQSIMGVLAVEKGKAPAASFSPGFQGPSPGVPKA